MPLKLVQYVWYELWEEAWSRGEGMQRSQRTM
jgi:uncharacterized membrane protein